MKKILYIILFLLVFIIIIIFLINIYVISFSRNGYFTNIDDLEKIETGLVLGSSIKNNGEPSDILKDRLIVAISSYNKGKIRKIIVSGDNRKDNYNEPASMEKFLIEYGVKKEDIYLDYAGFDTYDSIYRAKEIFGVESLIIFTQDFHLKRAMYISKRLGIKTYGIETNLQDYLNMNKNFVREVFARIKALIDVEFLKSKPKFLGEEIEIVSDKKVEEIKKQILEK